MEVLEEGRDQTVQREGFWAERSVDFCRFQLLSRKSIAILSTNKKKLIAVPRLHWYWYIIWYLVKNGHPGLSAQYLSDLED